MRNKAKVKSGIKIPRWLPVAIVSIVIGSMGTYLIMGARAMYPSDGGDAANNYYSCPYSPYPTIKSGSTNTACIKHLQWTLYFLYPDRGGQYISGIDGVFGSNTKKAVQVFQYTKKVPNSGCTSAGYTSCDGIVGQGTWNALEPDYALLQQIIKLLKNP